MRNTALKDHHKVETLDFQKARERFLNRKKRMLFQKCMGCVLLIIGILLCFFYREEVACGALAVCGLGVFLIITKDYVFTEGYEEL